MKQIVIAVIGAPHRLETLATNPGSIRSYDIANITRVDMTILFVGHIQNQAFNPIAIHNQTQGLLLKDIKKIP